MKDGHTTCLDTRTYAAPVKSNIWYPLPNSPCSNWVALFNVQIPEFFWYLYNLIWYTFGRVFIILRKLSKNEKHDSLAWPAEKIRFGSAACCCLWRCQGSANPQRLEDLSHLTQKMSLYRLSLKCSYGIESAITNHILDHLGILM